MSAPYGELQPLFKTTTPAGHPGSDVLIMRRPDGVLLRIQQGDTYLDAFISADGQGETLGDVLMDTAWTAQLEKRAAVKLTQRKDFMRWENEL